MTTDKPDTSTEAASQQRPRTAIQELQRLCTCGHKQLVHIDGGQECVGLNPQPIQGLDYFCSCKGFTPKEGDRP